MTAPRDPIHEQARVLRAYAIAATALLGVFALAAFQRASRDARFDTITVERINVVEKDGTVRLVISNKGRSPAPTMGGQVFGPAGERPGVTFYNDAGDESGGLGVAGRREGGKVSAFGGLFFDQFRQDQVVALQYTDENGQRQAGLQVLDRPEVPLPDVIARQTAVDRLPAGAARDSARRALTAYQGGVSYGAARLFAGRDPSKAAVVNLSDKTGRVRLRLAVDSAGTARIEFLDEGGRVTHRLPDVAAAVPPGGRP